MFIQNNRGENLAVDYIPAGQDGKGNVIFCGTPIIPVTGYRRCYEPIVNDGFNVYALDFAGTGASDGNIRNLSIQGICNDFDSVVEYISQQNGAPIFLFGDAGIGGLLAQCYASSTDRLRGFAQFSCANYQDASPLGMSKSALFLAYPLVRFLSRIAPNMKMKALPPKYNGYHADMDNAFYKDQLRRHPKLFHSHICFIRTLLDIICAADSPIQKGTQMPTLVFKTLHDRYFPSAYFDRYYSNLTCPKKLVEIDDVHNSYYIYVDVFASHVADWFSALR